VEKLDYKIKGVEDEKNAGYDKERILRRRMGVKRNRAAFGHYHCISGFPAHYKERPGI